MAQPLQAPFCQFFDANGNPLAGGKVFTYIAGTTTPQASYTDSTATVANANPVILDSAGRAQIWLQGFYKITVTDSLNNVISTADNITASTTSGDMNTSVYDPAAIQEQLVGLSAVQTLSNKTLNSPTITGVALSSLNPLINSNMSVAQRGTSFASISGTTPVRTLDGWFAWNGGTGSPAQSVSQISSVGLTGFNNAIRVQRPAANTSTTGHRVGQIIETRDCYRFAGKSCILSFWARRGSDFSASSNNINIRCQQGTGTDQGASALTGATWTSQTEATNTNKAITTSWVRYSVPVTFLSTTTEISVEFSFTPTGTASTNDYFDFVGAQLDTDVLRDYEFIPYAVNIARCQRLLHKTFPQATAPAQNVGIGNGEHLVIAGRAGAATVFGQLRFPQIMRAIPSIIYYNPAAANGQVRDISVSADCSAIGTQSVSDCAVTWFATGNASTAIGSLLGVNILASAEL